VTATACFGTVGVSGPAKALGAGTLPELVRPSRVLTNALTYRGSALRRKTPLVTGKHHSPHTRLPLDLAALFIGVPAVSIRFDVI